MAKKKKEVAQEDKRALLVQAFTSIEESDKLRDKKSDSTLVKSDIADLLREVILKQMRKDYDPEVNVRIIINPERGDFELYIIREVVEEIDIPLIQISLADVHEIDDSLEVGDMFEEGPMNLDKILTRKSIQIIKQAVQKKVRDAERQAMYEECIERIGEIVSAELYQMRGKETIFTYNTTKNTKVELVLPRSEMMPKDNPRKTPRMKLYIKRVERERVRVKQEDGTEIEKEREDGPMRVIVSRTDEMFLRKLFESEVPEINEGLIVIKGIARVPGERAKVSVESTSNRVDPVGACVGHKGKRIQNIVKELNNENIDVVSYSDEPQIYIVRALQPAQIDPTTVFVDYKNRKSRVMLKPNQIKYAIGKNGNNIHLAEKLTGFEIEIYREIDAAIEDSNDIDIIAFREEFGDDMIYQLLDAGLDTAKKIIEAGLEAVENALILSPKRDELFFEKRGFKPTARMMTEEERKHWRKIAESIFKTIQTEFEAETDDETEDETETETETDKVTETHDAEAETDTVETETTVDEPDTEAAASVATKTSDTTRSD
jgi:transcription termination/antitermination protein NusA